MSKNSNNKQTLTDRSDWSALNSDWGQRFTWLWRHWGVTENFKNKAIFWQMNKLVATANTVIQRPSTTGRECESVWSKGAAPVGTITHPDHLHHPFISTAANHSVTWFITTNPKTNSVSSSFCPSSQKKKTSLWRKGQKRLNILRSQLSLTDSHSVSKTSP